MTLGEMLSTAMARLSTALDCAPHEARIDVRALATHVFERPAAWLIAHDHDIPGAAGLARFQALLERRARGEPVAYLVGGREFFGRRFAVGPGVLIPRPETELLVETALEHLPPGKPLRVLDLGTGSGCIALTLALERPAARVVAVDRSAEALAMARHNAGQWGAAVDFLESDWFSALPGERFDLIVANPPYLAGTDPHLERGDLRFEPRSALASGPEGLDDPRRVIMGARAHLVTGGALWIEHGYTQACAVTGLFEQAGFVRIGTRRDLAGIERITGGHTL